MKQLALMVLAVCLTACARNVEKAKRCAPTAAKQMGFEIVGYEGYNLDPFYGGVVWYALKKNSDNGILYEAGFSPWGGECHLYELKAIDALKGTR